MPFFDQHEHSCWFGLVVWVFLIKGSLDAKVPSYEVLKSQQSRVAQSRVAQSRVAQIRVAQSRVAQSRVAQSRVPTSSLAQSRVATSSGAEGKVAQSLFSWQEQYLVKLECHFLWQAQHFVKFWEIAGARNVVFSIQNASPRWEE